MSKYIIWLLFLCLTSVASAQQIHWSSSTGYYANEAEGIVSYQLPSFKRQVVVPVTKLIAKGNKMPLMVKDFAFSSTGNKVLIFTNSKKVWRRETRGDYWVYDMLQDSLFQIAPELPGSSLMFAKFSPNATEVAFVSGHNLYVKNLDKGQVIPLTTDGTDRLINGTFDWAYEEEFDNRDGFRWSPDGRKIAFWQIDATKIRNFLLIDNTDSLYSFTVPVEYPKAGQDPSPAKIGVVDVSTGATTWMKLPGDAVQHYLPRMEWSPSGSNIVVEQLNRKQNEAKVFFCNAATGAVKEVYSEQNDSWIDVKARWSSDAEGWEWLDNDDSFLWVSEKDGWRHIYLLDANGKEIKVTTGRYDVIELLSIDKATNTLYFTASPYNATQQYLYRISLTGNNLKRLSPPSQDGTHRYTIGPDSKFALHQFSNHKNVRLSEWVSLPAHTTIKTIHGLDTAKSQPVPEFFTLHVNDSLDFDGWMIKPKNFDSLKKYPVLFQVYTEPASATVKDIAGAQGTRLYNGDIREDGYIQISIDGRGTPAPKGAAWRKSIYRKIGILNIEDQATAAQIISKWPYVDTSRIAVWGWSGGGSTTLNLMFKYPNIYKTGIAIAPVANQLLYDNIYQERYMGLPQENLSSYTEGSPITHAKHLRGNLLVVHGTGDDNVHYQGTEMLINELVRNNKQFQIMVYPNRTHSINEGEGTTAHLRSLFTNYLRANCPPGPR